MWPGVIVFFEPAVDDDLGLAGRREPFGVEDFSTQRAVETLVVSILPGCPSPLELGHYIGRERGIGHGEEETFRRRHLEAAA